LNPEPLSTAAILAGGRATRFDGHDKSALVVEGRTILDRQIAELSQITSDLLIVGGDTRAGVPEGVRHVADQVPGCGPLGGLHAALSAARGAAVLVVACDMPFLSAPLLRHLLTLADGAAGVDIVVPRTERGYHPLCAVYTRACLEPIARRLADGRLTLVALLDDVRVRVVTAEALAAFGDPDRLLANVNTPLEYRNIVANGIQS
jgi:molybdopterin-guanine dinucleotide biosynthesis protein A